MGAPFKGILFAGLMITAQGPKLIEYNVRFGDPECQVLMLRLMSDLLPALIAARDGQLKNFDLRWYDDAALVVVMAANGYPGDYGKGSVIEGLDAAAALEASRFSTPAPKPKAAASRRMAGACSALRRSASSVARGAEARLCGGGQDRLAGRLLPPRHRLSGDWARKGRQYNTLAGPRHSVYTALKFVYTSKAMTVLIRDEEADRMIRQLAERTGETITDAVKGAVSEKLAAHTTIGG